MIISPQVFLSSKIGNRLHIEHLVNPDASQAHDREELIEGLTQPQKAIAPKYFYDAKGSQLFEAICQLPEYYPTRSETKILEQYASEIAQITGNCELVELGSGSSTKTRLLLNAYQELDHDLFYVPIDVSETILYESAKQLLQEYDHLEVYGLVSTYQYALTHLRPSHLPSRMIFFLGSSVGNFNQIECDLFFSDLANHLSQGDYFLLGIDLQKPLNILEAAYNDSQGITAAFNLNMLAHLNRIFQGNFDLNLFKHHAFYNVKQNQIEMHLVSKDQQKVKLKVLDLEIKFHKEETILTEISRKFNFQEMEHYLSKKGLKPLHSWTDPQQWFGLLLTQLI
jgi:dimethylhistidine N-methyltransferase